MITLMKILFSSCPWKFKKWRQNSKAIHCWKQTYPTPISIFFNSKQISKKTVLVIDGLCLYRSSKQISHEFRDGVWVINITSGSFLKLECSSRYQKHNLPLSWFNLNYEGKPQIAYHIQLMIFCFSSGPNSSHR